MENGRSGEGDLERGSCARLPNMAAKRPDLPVPAVCAPTVHWSKLSNQLQQARLH